MSHVVRWRDGHPPEEIFEWLNAAGIAPHTRSLHLRKDRQVELHLDREDDAFMVWMAFSDDLEGKPKDIVPRPSRW